MKTSEQTDKLDAVMAKVQAGIEKASKDATNPHFNRRYADLTSIWDACRDALKAHGVVVYQGADGTDGNTVTVTTRLAFAGQWVECGLTLKPTKPDPQGIGSAITYGRRYGLAAMLGVCTEDDDGNAASNPPRREPRRSAPPAPDNGHAPTPPSDNRQRQTVSEAGLAFKAAAKEWTKLADDDLRAACRDIARYFNHATPLGLSDPQYKLMESFCREQNTRGVDFAEWAAAPEPQRDLIPVGPDPASRKR